MPHGVNPGEFAFGQNEAVKMYIRKVVTAYHRATLWKPYIFFLQLSLQIYLSHLRQEVLEKLLKSSRCAVKGLIFVKIHF